MARRSARSGFHWAAAMLAFSLWAGADLPARAQFFPFFGQPERPRPAPQPQARALTPEQVRAILAQEGAHMIGRPRRNGRDIVAIGRDDAGSRKRFTLDAVTGEVLDVTVLARREAPPPAPGAGALAPPGAPMSPPQHAPDSAATPVDAKAAPVSPSAPATTGSASRPSPEDDSALSPIRPQHPRGAPKVESLPQQ